MTPLNYPATRQMASSGHDGLMNSIEAGNAERKYGDSLHDFLPATTSMMKIAPRAFAMIFATRARRECRPECSAEYFIEADARDE